MKKKNRVYNRRRAKDIMTLCKALLLVLQIFIIVVGWDLMQQKIRFFAQTSFLLFLIYAIILFFMHRTYESFRVGAVRLLSLITGQFLALTISDFMLLMVATLSIRTLPNLWIFLAVYALQLIVSTIWCTWAHHVFFTVTPPKRTVVIYENEKDAASFDEIFRSSGKYALCKSLSVRDFTPPYDDLLAELEEMQSIFLADVPTDVRTLLFHYSTDHHIAINLRPSMDDVMLSTARRRFLANIPVLKVGLGTPALAVCIIKRTMDILISGLGLILASPLMAVLALLIRKEDHGPAIYRQNRLTLGGKVFQILKFRSMRVDAEKDGVARLASEHDSRITKIGHFIRATRLDELPQLWNIFKGDMSLVGPRPERPEIAEQYLAELPQFSARLQVKAGLTGYAQVNGKYNSTPEEKLQMDLMYISEVSIPLDLKLILQTIHIMMKKESTEGIQEGATTALKQ